MRAEVDNGTFKNFTFTDLRGLLNLDVEKLERISLAEFRTRYTNEMRSYFCAENDLIKCQDCPGLIKNPEELIRYLGANLHLDCFKERYYNERLRTIGLHDRRYFDLVLASVNQLEFNLK